jgi:carbohydrate diacid regulator
MAGWHLDTKMAQDIVARTMRIIDTNINVMDARGRIIGSGDRERLVNCTKARCWCFPGAGGGY